MTKCVVVLSGGQDSTTCLFNSIRKFGKDNVYAVTFDYGQRHAIELESAAIVAKLAGVAERHETIVLPKGLLHSTSPLVSDNELEQYADANSLPGGIEKTFVPMRNQFFLTLAANRCASVGAEALVTGVSGEDYGGYPDCRMNFIGAFQIACNTGTFTGEEGAPKKLRVEVPLMFLTKKETVEMAVNLGPECYRALSYSHTAYDGKYPPTGKDHASLLRARGFEEALVSDPLVLRAYLDGTLERLPDTPNYTNSCVEEGLHLIDKAGGFNYGL